MVGVNLSKLRDIQRKILLGIVMQLDIFDAIRERDEAMDAIEGVTNRAFTECATEAIKTVGRMRLQFTTDDVWDWC